MFTRVINLLRFILNEFNTQIDNRENKLLVNNFSFLACENLCWDEEFLSSECIMLCYWDQPKLNDSSVDDEK